MGEPKLLAFSGSARQASINQKLVTQAAALAESAGAVVRLINLRDYPMPLYNQDDEDAHGEPDAARELKAIFKEHDGFLIASPEYNGLVTPLLKNTLDWLSRKAGDEPSMVAYRGKTAALMATSYGKLGGLRGLVHARALLNNLGVLTIPKQAAIGGAGDAFNADDSLARDGDIALLENVVSDLVRVTRAQKS